MNERDHDGSIHRFCAIIKDHGRKYVLGTCYKGLKYVAEYFDLRMNTARFARNVAKWDFLRDFQHCGKFSWKQDYFYTMTAMLINVAGQRFWYAIPLFTIHGGAHFRWLKYKMVL